MRGKLGISLICIGVLLCGRAAWSVAKYQAFKAHPQLVMAARDSLPSASRPGPGLRIVGKVEIPRLKLSTLVVDGDDEESLSYAAGHVRGTAELGGSGNAAIAGHRDSSFRELRWIRVGDSIQVGAGRFTYKYVVRSTQIVSPEDMEVLATSKTPVLTLITCYPFHYLGSAPKRFVVRAEIQPSLSAKL